VQEFLREHSRLYVNSRCGEVFVCPFENDPTRVAGYYCFANSSLRRGETTNQTQKVIPQGVSIPVFIIGHFGRDAETERGFGAELIVDAAKRGHASGNVSWGLTLFAGNRGLIQYYTGLGFTPARDTAKRLQLPETDEEARDYLMYARYADLIDL
jgi:hypothetical protein